MSVILRATYRRGIFEPEEPVEGLSENQQVELQIWPLIPVNGSPQEGTELWFNNGEEDDWETLDPWEQMGLHPPTVTEAEKERRLQQVELTRGVIRLPSDVALEIAMADWLAEENLDL